MNPEEQSGFSPENNNQLDNAREAIGNYVVLSNLPTEECLGFKSTVEIYGGSLKEDSAGHLIWDNRSFAAQFDQKGDVMLRKWDEHVVKEPGKMFRRHPTAFLRHFFTGPKRYRGTKEEIVANAQRLGLGEYYGLHPWGVEIKRPEIYKQGLALQDIYRADLIETPVLNDIDRFQALATAAEYVRQIHDRFGAIGELLSNDIIFQAKEGSRVINPILNTPDIVFNPNKTMSSTEQKATDILDFLIHIGAEEFRKSNDPEKVNQALKTILDNYGDKQVINAVSSLARRGRLVLPEDPEDLALPNTISSKARKLFMQHNMRRVSSTREIAHRLREQIINLCQS